MNVEVFESDWKSTIARVEAILLIRHGQSRITPRIHTVQHLVISLRSTTSDREAETVVAYESSDQIAQQVINGYFSIISGLAIGEFSAVKTVEAIPTNTGFSGVCLAALDYWRGKYKRKSL
jgi:hypothetical protein